jgi:putative endonuclease
LRQQPDKQFILDSLAAIARGAGRPPSRSEFVSLPGISEHSISRFFPTWIAALRAAGLPPYTLNLRLDDRELLEDWGYAVRRNRAIPARRTYHHLGKFDHRTFIPGFTQKYNCTKLVWFEPHSTARAAISREKEIKRWNRAKKIALLESLNPHWTDLSSNL